MIGSAIRELVATRRVPLICAAFNESIVQVWDLSTQQKIAEFAARFDFGARTLAVHPGGEYVVTGISRRNGRIAGYKMPSGEPTWHCDQMTYPGWIRFGASGESVFCTLDNCRVIRMDARTGERTEVLKGIVHYVEGPNGYTFTAPASDSSYLLRNEHLIPIPKLTFAVLDVAFGADRLCISEATGPVRCIDYLTGAEHWRFTPPESHVLKLHHDRLDRFFYGVVRHYQKGDFRYLVRFNAETGETTRVRDLNSWEEVFSEATQQLVTSSGEIIDLSSGELVGELAFPRLEYPDRVTLT